MQIGSSAGSTCHCVYELVTSCVHVGWVGMEHCDGRSGMLYTCLEERQLGLQSQVCRHSAVDVVEHEDNKLLGSGGKHSQRIDKYTPNVAHRPQ